MPLYQYTGRNQQGDMVNGELEATSTSDTAGHLINIGITPVEIHLKGSEQANVLTNLKSTLFNQPPDINDLIMFSRQMATLLKAGISILPALRGLKAHMTNVGLSNAINDIATDLEGGRSLAGSMQKFPDIFPNLFI